MSGFYFFFALVASYSLCITGLIPVDCLIKAEESCDQSLSPDTFPETVDQLRDACRRIKELDNCMLKIFESCTEDPAGTKEIRRIVGYIHDVCREDSEIFQVISSNLHCIASNTKKIDESCTALSFSEPTKELITNLFQYANKSQIEKDRPDVSCSKYLWEDYCLAIKVGISCGSEVGATVKELFTQLQDRDICYEEFVAEVTPMLELIELAIVEEENLEKMEEEEKEPLEENGGSRKKRFAYPLRAFRDKFY